MSSNESIKVPTFAVVGKVNMGKTSVLSTLLEQDDNSILRVSSTPGETTHCQNHSLTVDQEELIRFIDTPGFSRPIEAMREIQEIQGSATTPNIESIKHFITRHKTSGEFSDEILLLESLTEGVGVIYVVDASRPLRDTYLAEMEILRWTGCQRLAILNNHSDDDLEAEWKKRLGSFFNLVRTFNAHKANYPERLKLLRSLLEIEESRAEQIKKTIQAIEDQWFERREESAETILEMIQSALGHKETLTISKRDCENERRREKAIEELEKNYFSSIRKIEEKAFNHLLKIYKHHRLDSADDADRFKSLDLEAEETWSKWGLTRNQLAIAGGLTGGAAGACVDLGTGGVTQGAGTIVGTLLGAATTYFKGGSLPNFSLSFDDLTNSSSQAQRKLIIGAPDNQNFAWVLLDSIFHRYTAITSRAHGRRDDVEISNKSEHSFVRELEGESRRVLTRWIQNSRKAKPDYQLEPKVLETLSSILSTLHKK